MTENNAAQLGLTDDEIKAIRDSLGGGFLGPIPFARAIESALLSKLRAEGVQAGELPPLPEPTIEGSVLHPTYKIAYSAPVHFTAGQMREYARAALASAPVADESPMAKMADALREKARQERQAYQDSRVQTTEWGPMPVGIINAARYAGFTFLRHADGSYTLQPIVMATAQADKDGGDCAKNKGAEDAAPEE